MHPSTAQILRHFRYEHLPPQLAAVSRPFAELAEQLAGGHLGRLDGPELTAGLRKLLEAKDCAVRAALPPTEPAGDRAITTDAEGNEYTTATRSEAHPELYGQREEPGLACEICGTPPGGIHDGSKHGMDSRDAGVDARAKQEPGPSEPAQR